MADAYGSATHISDIVVPSVFHKYLVEQTAEKSVLLKSGIVDPDVNFDDLAAKGGKTINMPYFTDLTGDDEVLSDQSALTPAKIGTDTDVAVLLGRGKAWGVNDLARALSGEDPMGAIVNLASTYWARKEQAVLLDILKGVFASTAPAADGGMASTNSMSTESAIDASIILDAKQKLGDSAEKLAAMAMNSATYTRLQKLNLIDAIPDSNANVGFGTYMGKYSIIVDDTIAVESGKYPVYLFGKGAIARGEGAAPVPVETDRDSLAGEDILVTRRHYILHPRGVKWKGTAGGAFPTNTELQTGGNWERVYEYKNVRMVKLLAPIA